MGLKNFLKDKLLDRKIKTKNTDEDKIKREKAAKLKAYEYHKKGYSRSGAIRRAKSDVKKDKSLTYHKPKSKSKHGSAFKTIIGKTARSISKSNKKHKARSYYGHSMSFGNFSSGRRYRRTRRRRYY